MPLQAVTVLDINSFRHDKILVSFYYCNELSTIYTNLKFYTYYIFLGRAFKSISWYD